MIYSHPDHEDLAQLRALTSLLFFLSAIILLTSIVTFRPDPNCELSSRINFEQSIILLT
jgi:hypothetical protein